MVMDLETRRVMVGFVSGGFVVQCGAISDYMSCKACKQSKQHSLTCSIISIRASQLGTVATSWFPKRHVLLAIIKPYLSHMYTRPFCVLSKVKRFNNAK